MIAVYLRVSTHQQDTDSQEYEIKHFLNSNNMTNIAYYTDIGISGMSSKRPEYQRLCEDVNNGKITAVVVYKLDRLGRDAIASMRLLLDWIQRGVGFYSVTQPILQLGTENPFRITIISIFSELAQVERTTIVQRVKSGLAAARERGVRLGAMPKHDMHRDTIIEMRAAGASVIQINKKTGIPTSTIYRILKGKTNDTARS